MCIEINKIKEKNSFNAEESAYFAYEWIRKNIELNCEDDQKQEQSPQNVYTSGFGLMEFLIYSKQLGIIYNLI
jgi:hypothetical protein